MVCNRSITEPPLCHDSHRIRLDPASAAFATQRSGMAALIEQMQVLERRASDASERARPAFAKRGALLPRERPARLLDPGSPYLALAKLAGYGMDDPDHATSIPGGSLLAGIGFVCGVRCMVVVTDSGIDAGAMTEGGNLKMMRCRDRAGKPAALRPPVESAGANLRKYRVDKFIRGGAIFYNWRGCRPPACR